MLLALAGFLTLRHVASAASVQLLPPTRLRTDHAAQPLSIQHQNPRLSWALAASPATRGLRQTAYQAQLYNATHYLMWDSSKVASNRSVVEHCCGATMLRSDAAYYWQVRAWQQTAAAATTDTVSPWSASAHFDTALLNASEWGSAHWIGTGDVGTPDSERNLLRTEFTLPSLRITRARVYISGLGYYRMHVNGQRADSHELGSLTTYERTLLYDAVDVGSLLRPGAANALGITLGRGWYACSGCLALRLGEACGRAGTANATNPYGDNTCGQYPQWPLGPTGIITCASPCPRTFILRLTVSFEDGSSFKLVSDTNGQWQQSDGPVVSESIYLGVVHDARKEQPGWTLPGFVPSDAARWKAAQSPAATPAGTPGTLLAQSMPQIEKVRTLSPNAITIPRPGVFLVDFGENMAGWITLTIPGNFQRGDNVTIVHGELLTTNGRCYTCIAPWPKNVTRYQDCPCRR